MYAMYDGFGDRWAEPDCPSPIHALKQKRLPNFGRLDRCVVLESLHERCPPSVGAIMPLLVSFHVLDSGCHLLARIHNTTDLTKTVTLAKFFYDPSA